VLASAGVAACANSGGFGRARSHSAATCRLKAIQKVGPNASSKLRRPKPTKMACQIRIVPTATPTANARIIHRAVVHHVVAANGPDGQRQAGQEPEAKDDRSGGLNDPAEGIQDAEDDREDPRQQRRSGQHPTESAVEGVVAAAEAVGQLQERTKQVEDAGADVQVREPMMLHEPQVVGIRGERARSYVGHIDRHTPRNCDHHDEKKRATKTAIILVVRRRGAWTSVVIWTSQRPSGMSHRSPAWQRDTGTLEPLF
jgi:hypothetical protein